MKLAVFGYGGMGRETLQLAEWQNAIEHRWDEIFFVDDGLEEAACFGVQRMHFDTAVARYGKEDVEYVIALGEPSTKRSVFQKVDAAGCKFGRVIAPSATVFGSSELGRSIVLDVSAIVRPGAVVGDGVIVGGFGDVGHDSVVGDFCHVGGKCNIGGTNTVGAGTFLGLQSATKQGLSIGSNVTIGMGSVVIRDVPDNVVVVGNPARIIKERNENTKALSSSVSVGDNLVGGGVAASR